MSATVCASVITSNFNTFCKGGGVTTSDLAETHPGGKSEGFLLKVSPGWHGNPGAGITKDPGAGEPAFGKALPTAGWGEWGGGSHTPPWPSLCWRIHAQFTHLLTRFCRQTGTQAGPAHPGVPGAHSCLPASRGVLVRLKLTYHGRARTGLNTGDRGAVGSWGGGKGGREVMWRLVMLSRRHWKMSYDLVSVGWKPDLRPAAHVLGGGSRFLCPSFSPRPVLAQGSLLAG